ncbi:MAG: sigma-54-dependent Fis family transcriptional regulator [Desulfobacteraceae bacterium]|nr:MAG: sigma-54-dependent Fis family transcriptional regulator [Desulfobacteraceae bacterium]
MSVDENTFFRQVTLRVCGNLDFEIALQECLIYLRSFMPGDRLHLNLYDRGLGALRTIAVATPTEARRVNIVMPLNDEGRRFLDDPNLPPVLMWNRLLMDPVAKSIVQRTGQMNDSLMVMHLGIKGTRLGNLVLYAEGHDRYSQEHLRLFSTIYEPVAIALSNALRYDELNQLKELMADDIQYLQGKLNRLAEEDVIGEGFGLKEVMEMANEVAPLDSPVLLQGETGVGKEIVATAIHRLSRRKDGPFIQVNCGAIPETLIDSELFGHERGAFTGAISQKRGCFERADGGTIFLDEVGELPPQAQVRMLRVLQDKIIHRVGGASEIKVDIRIIAATHQNLYEMVQNKQFRADLWFRLHVFPITIPPLRERTEDIPALVNHFMEKKFRELQLAHLPRLAPGAIAPLMAYSWPGNVRELENVVERALILSKGRPVTFDSIVWPDAGDEERAAAKAEKDESLNIDYINAKHLRKVLKMTKGRINGPSGAAVLLGLNPSTLRHRLKTLKIPHGRGKY